MDPTVTWYPPYATPAAARLVAVTNTRAELAAGLTRPWSRPLCCSNAAAAAALAWYTTIGAPWWSVFPAAVAWYAAATAAAALFLLAGGTWDAHRATKVILRSDQGVAVALTKPTADGAAVKLESVAAWPLGTGLGGRLVATLLNEPSTYRLTAVNHRAARFYARCGFHRTRRTLTGIQMVRPAPAADTLEPLKKPRRRFRPSRAPQPRRRSND